MSASVYPVFVLHMALALFAGIQAGDLQVSGLGDHSHQEDSTKKIFFTSRLSEMFAHRHWHAVHQLQPHVRGTTTSLTTGKAAEGFNISGSF